MTLSAEGTVKVPLAGQVKKRWVMVAAAAAGGFVIWRYWQASRTPPAGAAPSDGTVNDGSVVDSPPGAPSGGNVQYAGTYPKSDTPTTNSAWSQAAIEYLVDSAGYGAAAVTEALGNYLAGNGLTDAQVTIVRAALAVEGPPPQGSYVIHHAVNQTPADPGSQVPAAPAGLTVTQSNTGGIRVQWAQVPGAKGYRGSFDGQYWFELGYHNAFGGAAPRPGARRFVAGQHVRVMVRAYNAKGQGPVADTVITVTK